ncbi:MAG: PAS domain-containing protein [Scytonema sp. PMC 1069.18]|nr:PAS domain-containing protein [Scytonema sp. PMC 1069.18]
MRLTRQLEQSREQQQLIAAIALRIRQSLKLEEIWRVTAAEVRQFLKVDRVLVYQFQPDMNGTIVAESVLPGWTVAQGVQIQDTCFQRGAGADYRQGKKRAIDDIYQAGLTNCHLRLLEQFEVKANLVVPILVADQLWGLLIAHQCTTSRHWQSVELDLLDQLAVQISIAIQQASAYEQIQAELIERKRAEETLRESEERFRMTFEQAAVGMSHVSLNGQFLRLNQRFCDIAGYPQAELQKLTFQDITHPDDLTTDLEQMQKLLAGEIQTYSMEKRYIRKDGSTVWINLTVSLMKDRFGAPKYFISVIEDITTRKQAEMLRIELQLLENILEITLAGYWDWDISGNREYLSPMFKQMFGYEDWELPNTPETWQRLIFPEDLPQVVERFNQHIQSRGQIPYYNEVRYRHKNGSTVWVICSGRVIEWDRDGNPLRMIGCHIDISERKQTEEQLRHLSERLSLAIRSGGIGIWEYDFVQEKQIWDDRMYELYGIVPGNFAGTLDAWLNCLHPDDRDNVQETIQQVLQKNKEYDTDFRIVQPNQEVRFLKAYGILNRDHQGNPIRIIGVNFDITDRKQAEQELRQMNEQLAHTNVELARATRLKDEFLANMSHELRTPLNAILGMSEGFLEGVFGSINEHQVKAIATIERSGKHLLELINDILDLSKIESGKLELELSDVPVKNLCDGALAFVKQMALTKNIRLSTSISETLGYIHVDDRRLRQVLINLLSNAIKFTPEGGSVTLEIWVEQAGVQEPRGAKENDLCSSSVPFLCFSITDTGIGIASKDISKLFQPFIQLDSSLNRQYNGTGLGLALVHRIVALHGGTVSVSSEIEQGSCFTVRIPYLSSDRSFFTQVKAPFSSHQLPTENASVLIVEDSIPAADQMTRYLSEIGLQPTVYPRGEGAVEEVQRIQPAFIILDIQLPNLSGWDVLAQLKINPQTQEIPVIIISVMDEHTKGLAQGAFDYLVKPITRPQIKATLEKLQYPVHPNSPAFIVTSDPSVEPPLILLAEDNQANIDTISGYLESRGYRLTLAKNGQQAINTAKAQRPDLIVMDIQMPIMDGLEAIRQIRNDPQVVGVPIIALTALAMPGDREICLAAGASEYLTKPIKLKQLVLTIQQLLKK